MSKVNADDGDDVVVDDDDECCGASVIKNAERG